MANGGNEVHLGSSPGSPGTRLVPYNRLRRVKG